MAKIGIMGAMVEEIEPLLKYYQNYETIEFADNKFYYIDLGQNQIYIAYSKIGKVFASLTASALIIKFGCEKILFSGVAGAVSSELKVGDLIVANKLCQHDLDITAFGHPFGYVPEGKIFVEADLDLIDIAKQVALNQNLNLKIGTIATGDQFVASNDRKNFILNEFNADALEMEGASVAVVCNALNTKFLILRSISDAADVDASFDFDEFLKTSAQISANFLVSLVNTILNKK
jgi:adenosylhomocysteine/aminodeoxyfutalosine nucleosidase